MTDDALAALERVKRILGAVSDHGQILEKLMPDYARGLRFAYETANTAIQNEINQIEKDRAAQAEQTK